MFRQENKTCFFSNEDTLSLIQNEQQLSSWETLPSQLDSYCRKAATEYYFGSETYQYGNYGIEPLVNILYYNSDLLFTTNIINNVRFHKDNETTTSLDCKYKT